MSIDWTHFTPWSALAGGVLIGIAAAMFALLNGRIAGISGILGGLLNGRREDASWRIAFLAGLLLAPSLWIVFAPAVQPRIEASTGMLLLAGLVVGIGTSYGSGCTSGHGVCGLARLSPRSMAAVGTFMATAIATVLLVRHVL